MSVFALVAAVVPLDARVLTELALLGVEKIVVSDSRENFEGVGM